MAEVDLSKLDFGTRATYKFVFYDNPGEDISDVLADNYFYPAYETGTFSKQEIICVRWTNQSAEIKTIWLRVYMEDGIVKAEETTAEGTGGGGAGDVIGPASSTEHALATYADTSGKLLSNLSQVTAFAGQLNGAVYRAGQLIEGPNYNVNRNEGTNIGGQITIREGLEGYPSLKKTSIYHTPNVLSTMAPPTVAATDLLANLDEDDGSPTDAGMVYDNTRGSLQMYDRTRSRWMSYKNECVTIYIRESSVAFPISDSSSVFFIATLSSIVVDPNNNQNEGLRTTVASSTITAQSNYYYRLDYQYNFSVDVAPIVLLFGVLYLPSADPASRVLSMYNEIEVPTANKLYSVSSSSGLWVPEGTAGPYADVDFRPIVSVLPGGAAGAALNVKNGSMTMMRCS